MQAQVSSTRTVTGRHTRVLKALGGTALALAVATGVVLWRGTGQRDEGTAPAVASLQAEPAAVEHTGSVFGASATPQEIQGTAQSAGSVIYITRSEEEAAGLRWFIAEISALSIGADRASRGVTVLVASSPEDEARVHVEIAHLLDVQHSIGLPVSKVFDLRAR